MSLPLQNAWFWSLVACIAAALSEGIAAGTRVKARFAEFRLPKGAPRLWAWLVIGGAYYVLFFFLLRSVLVRPSIPYWTEHAGIQSEVSVAITPEGTGSELVIRHEKLGRADAIERHAAGWRGAVDQLTELLAQEEQNAR